MVVSAAVDCVDEHYHARLNAAGRAAAMIFLSTSPFPTKETLKLVRFAFSELDSDVDVAVWLKACYTATYRGRAWNGVPAISRFHSAKACRYLVTLGVNEDNIYPYECGHAEVMKRAPAIEVGSWRELLIVVAAHEARHIRQFKLRKPHSEVDCEQFALRMLMKHRSMAIQIAEVV